MLDHMTDTGAHPTPDRDPAPDSLPGAAHSADFSRHDVDVNAPDAVQERDEATFDRHDVDPNAPDAVDEVDEATYDRHDTER
jgi:hypothetical protein